MINRKHMKLVISEVAVDEQSQFTASIVSNFGGEDHTPLEIAAAIKKFQNWGVTLDQIASRFVKSISWVSQHLRILQLSDEVLELMDPELPEDEQLTYSIAIELACLPKKLQFNAARIIMSREMKLAAARNFIRDEADKAGAPCVERRKRRPDDEYRVLSSFLKRVERDINLHSQRTQEFYDSMFSFRSQQDPMDSIMAATRIKEKMDLLSSKIRESVEKQKARYKSQKALRSA
ncbi:MAG: hypothetical protein A2562_02225 [Candidatus Nealsonbacteria bacterium RIFOXYD1_FULL_39_11]|nr:MAG: hypothetical protein A2562_02225 [Candidatus Nealsonbacteria bacterium RIFOXYD1_FULL_39_11]